MPDRPPRAPSWWRLLAERLTRETGRVWTFEDAPTGRMVSTGTPTAALHLGERYGVFPMHVTIGTARILAQVWVSAPPAGDDAPLQDWLSAIAHIEGNEKHLGEIATVVRAVCERTDGGPVSALEGVAVMAQVLKEQERRLEQLEHALEVCRLTDRSAVYDPGEARPDGTAPASPQSAWLVPRQIVDGVLGGAGRAA